MAGWHTFPDVELILQREQAFALEGDLVQMRNRLVNTQRLQPTAERHSAGSLTEIGSSFRSASADSRQQIAQIAHLCSSVVDVRSPLMSVSVLIWNEAGSAASSFLSSPAGEGREVRLALVAFSRLRWRTIEASAVSLALSPLPAASNASNTELQSQARSRSRSHKQEPGTKSE